MMRLALAVVVMAWAGAAGAQLYRWVDPESGSVRFSSHPPPWYGDEAKQRRAPRVEVIPAARDATAKPEAKPDLRDAPPVPEGRSAAARKALEKALRGEAK